MESKNTKLEERASCPYQGTESCTRCYNSNWRCVRKDYLPEFLKKPEIKLPAPEHSSFFAYLY